jgi:hypothetical protein
MVALEDLEGVAAEGVGGFGHGGVLVDTSKI